MQKLVLIVLLFISNSVYSFAQELSAKETVVAFFNAFNQKDTVTLRTLIHPEMMMMSSFVDHNGQLTNDVKSGHYLIGFMGKAIKKKFAFKESISDLKIEQDSSVAMVFMNYVMYVGDELNDISHCGVNAFTLIKDPSDTWSVSFIADSRYKNCNPK